MQAKLTVQMVGNPCILVREVMPYDDEATIKEKNKKPFMALKSAILKVTYGDKKYILSNKSGYCYDGASIPFKIGKGNMKLLIPSLFHDIMCDDKTLIDKDRRLSSLIFKELLIQCKVNKITAQIMYLAVEVYQSAFSSWK